MGLQSLHSSHDKTSCCQMQCSVSGRLIVDPYKNAAFISLDFKKNCIDATPIKQPNRTLTRVFNALRLQI